MWDINKGLIQIEVGSGVIRQFTRKDTRGAVQKLLGASALNHQYGDNNAGQ